ncbi:tetratricopeptide repeat protein [Chitinophaga agrisoli]|uniref:Tetratricopeptide repeat protein n=1 Tax=Chitinophaga agrisoli TaxID=2607653 RepID=A0A5B2VKU4_9BACT|nr:tetratricopeptide repeat protein [Chitinophaga agrisoli]KAA2238877.1 tetratricopeptide repeat protein [Chitinophaga agrisoli]
MKVFSRLLILLALPFCTNPRVSDADNALFDHSLDLLAAKQLDSVQSIAGQLLKKHKDVPEFYDLRGLLQQEKKQADSALEDFNTAIKMSPKRSIFYAHRAGLYMDMQMPDKAIRDYNLAIAHVDGDTMRYQLICSRGSARKMKRDFQGAYDDYMEGFHFDSTNVDVLSSLGGVLDDLGREQEAILYLERAIHISPDDMPANVNLGFRYLSLGDYEKAIRLFNHALEIDPDQPLAYNNRGYAEYKLNKLQDALKDITHSLSLYPDNSYAYKNRALVYLALKQQDKACDDLQRAAGLHYTARYGNEVDQLIAEHCR